MTKPKREKLKQEKDDELEEMGKVIDVLNKHGKEFLQEANKTEWEEKIRKIVEKHVLPKVKTKHGDLEMNEIMTKMLAYELGLDEVVESYVKDFRHLLKQEREKTIKTIQEFPALKRGSWVIHPDWINREDLLSELEKG